jgi:hypothetical protein
MYDFITLMAPHIDRALIDRAPDCDGKGEVDALFADVQLANR